MTPANALRFLDHEAQACRDRDSHEALCLLLPSILRALDLEPMTQFEALEARLELRNCLREKFLNPKKSGAASAAGKS